MKKSSELSIALVILVVLLFFVSHRSNTIEEAMEEKNIQANQILYKVPTDKGVVVFYEPTLYQGGCSVGLVKKNMLEFKWVSGIGVDFFNDVDPVTWGFGNIGESVEIGSENSFPIAYGVITDDHVKRVKVKLTEEFTDATVVETNLGNIWYYFPQNITRFRGVNVLGIDHEEKVIYDNWNRTKEE